MLYNNHDNSRLEPENRAAITELHHEGYSVKTIAQRLQLSAATVSLAIKQLKVVPEGCFDVNDYYRKNLI